jgi:hypothetical protein
VFGGTAVALDGEAGEVANDLLQLVTVLAQLVQVAVQLLQLVGCRRLLQLLFQLGLVSLGLGEPRAQFRKVFE